ncbi:hypothetical protein [Natranaeroarchaeum aerophilus]|uniref:DUF1102 domain-containing protein n=1 Tax=Natranaeroarchaeum aerophilus TaxID=2917711 RepID=A0AAE3FR40_9EURY|nr:hypothetical protein [Natranaeroarchaeum aerophilus]MCL9813555.1 hypothetical protein [Natranaeroarchaeum aerophilus]
MKSNRRSVLIGLGALTVGGGAVFGTGAFSSVEANRTVEVAVADDSSALVGLQANDSDYVTEEDGLLVIDLSDQNLGDASGVNRNATISIDNAFTIVNNSDSDIDITFDIDDPSPINIEFEPVSPDGITDEEDISIDIITDGATDGDNFSGEVTITATPSPE